MIFIDKNNQKLEDGMSISFEGHTPEMLFACDIDGKDGLGVNASRHAVGSEFYPLTEFPHEVLQEGTIRMTTGCQVEFVEVREYKGHLFTYADDLTGYVAKSLANDSENYEEKYDTDEFKDEYFHKVKHEKIEWKTRGKNQKFAFAVEPILSTIRIIAHTTLDKDKLQDLIKELQIAVNRLGGEEFYGK